MKPGYFRDVETEDEDSIEEVKDDIRGQALHPNAVNIDILITIDNASQVTLTEVQEIIKSILVTKKIDVEIYNDNRVVCYIPQDFTPFAQQLNQFLIEKASDIDIQAKEHEGKILYNTCITPDNPFNADEFVSSISHALTPSRLPSETMCIEINKEPLNIIMKKDDIVSDGMGTYANYKWTEDLNTWFQKGNWHCNMSYVVLNAHLKNSTLPYQVFVYECLPYIREEGNYLIETQMPLEISSDLNNYSGQTDILIFSCYSPDDPTATSWTGYASMKFLGIYRLDKEKSLKENYLSFRLIKDTFQLRIRSTHNR